MTTQLNFTDRTSYIAWRADWRAEYKALSQEIRSLKITSKSGTQDEQSRAQSKLSTKSAEATAKLKLRAKSKALSATQREAAKTERAAA